MGKYGYIFNVDITAKPDLVDAERLRGAYRDSIDINLKLENTNISLFERAEEAYEKYTRFEILDL